MRRKLIIQPLSVEQHFHGIEADATAIGMLLRAVRTAIKRVEDVLELLFGEWFADIFDSQLMLVASNFYDAAGIAVAHRI